MTGLMKCEKCDTLGVRVKDSRVKHFSGHVAIRRRRFCSACGFAFTTYEVSLDVLENEANLTSGVRLKRVRDRLIAALEELDAPIGVVREIEG